MPRTVWYPGHMAKGKRQLEALASNIDLIIEVRDARAPILTSSPILDIFKSKIEVWVVLSKTDLADKKITDLWIKTLKKEHLQAWPLDLRKGNMSCVKKAILARKPSFRDLRMAVVGTPNVGKSMLINQLIGRRAARVGGIPGITKGVSWFKGQGFLLVDSPGILDPRSGAMAHRIISWIGSSRGQVIGSWEEHAKDCISFIVGKNLWYGIEKVWNVKAEGEPTEILENIGRRLGKLQIGGVIDMEGVGRMFIDSFAAGKFGRMSFERPGEQPAWNSFK